MTSALWSIVTSITAVTDIEVQRHMCPSEASYMT
jgi:hypothetical protein